MTCSLRLQPSAVACELSIVAFCACADMAAAVAAGKVSQEILQRYLALSESLLAPLMKLGCVSCLGYVLDLQSLSSNTVYAGHFERGCDQLAICVPAWPVHKHMGWDVY